MQPGEIAACQRGLLAFSAVLFQARKGAPFIYNEHQDRICSALERVVLGLCPRLIINVPPRSGKTELAVVNFMAWALGLFPDSEWIHASYSGRLAGQNTFNVRTVMETPTFQEVFPWTALIGEARDEFRTAQGGVVYASGALGSITGYGAGKMRDGFGGAIIIDDPHKAGEASSEAYRQKVIDWFTVTMESRKNRPSTPIILIMQRLHEEDLSGFLLAGGNGEEWEHLLIPAIDEHGESFWERQFPIADLRRREAANPYVFAGQYMQTPSPKGGGIFPRARVELWEHPPLPKEIRASLRYWDKAGTAGGGAYTAGVLLHLLRDGRVVVGDVRRAQLSVLDREALMRQTAEVDGKRVPIWVEQEPGSGGLESAQATIRALRGWQVKADRPTGDKEVRAHPYATFWQGGQVGLVRADWNMAFLDEHESFPMGRYKDQVDAAAAGFNILTLAPKSRAVSMEMTGLM